MKTETLDFEEPVRLLLEEIEALELDPRTEDTQRQIDDLRLRLDEVRQDIFKNLTKLRDKIGSSKDLKKFTRELKKIEKEITLFHVEAVKEIIKKTKVNIDLVGFHGQTIYHNAKEKISKQLGNGKLLSKLIKKTVVYNFRENDLHL